MAVILKRIVLVIFLAAAMVAAQSMIQPLDSVLFDAGTIHEGTQKTIKHGFKIKNTGSTLLTIKQVRPGCGCTLVGFDSLVKPGKTGVITSEIDLSKLHGGEITKSVLVMSNAQNLPELKLSTRFFLVPVIGLEPNFITLKKIERNRSEGTLLLTTDSKNLQIKKLSFNNDATGTKTASDRTIIFTLMQKDTVAVNGKTMFRYKLAIIYNNENSERKYGTFNLQTNHPQKTDISFSGIIEDNR